MADKPSLVHVEIFGQTYSVKAGADPGYVEQLAAHVDQQMREVSRSGGSVDSVRIAVLAALNIADECFRLRASAETATSGSEARARELARDLAEALGE
jgi:cell division protein ZapA